MPLILAIEPDRRQAARISSLAKERLNVELLVVDSAERALDALQERTPDLILTPHLLSPKDEAALDERLRELDAAGSQVQTLMIPVLASTGRRAPGGVVPAQSAATGRTRHGRRVRPGDSPPRSPVSGEAADGAPPRRPIVETSAYQLDRPVIATRAPVEAPPDVANAPAYIDAISSEQPHQRSSRVLPTQLPTPAIPECSSQSRRQRTMWHSASGPTSADSRPSVTRTLARANS
jgi:CheY-like chemotaxis protein